MKPAGPWAPLGRSQDRRALRNMCAQAAHSLPSKKRRNGGLHHASNASVQKQNPQNARRNTLPGEQISRWFLLLSEKLSASNYPGAAYNRGGIRSASRGFRDDEARHRASPLTFRLRRCAASGSLSLTLRPSPDYLGVSHLLPTLELNQLRTLLYKSAAPYIAICRS